MRTYDLVNREDANCYPGHLIELKGTSQKITGIVTMENGQGRMEEMPLESAIHHALLLRQRTALPIGVVDDSRLWPERLGKLVAWPK